MNIGEKITNLRKSKGITQEQLAEQLGVTRQTISKWELDQSTPDLNYISQLSELFGVTTDYLIKGKEEEKKEERESVVVIQETQKSHITPVVIAGIIFCAIAALLLLVGIVYTMESEEWLILIFLGFVILIAGLEMIFVKKFPFLTVMWTVWGIIFVPLIIFTLRMRVGFYAMNTVGGIVGIMLTIFAIILTIVTIRARKRK